MKVQFRKIVEALNHITGISTPVFGISWNPPETEVKVAMGLITFLENRRVLYVDYHQEFPPYVAESIIEIRDRFTQDLENLPPESELAENVRAMRAACIQFMGETDEISCEERKSWGNRMSWNESQKMYFKTLGRFRVTMGYYISLICAGYGIDVDANLARILPASPNNQLTVEKRNWGQ